MEDAFQDMKQIFTANDQEFPSLFQDELRSARRMSSSQSYELPRKNKPGRKKTKKKEKFKCVHFAGKRRSFNTEL